MKMRKVGTDGVVAMLDMPPREFEVLMAGIEAEVRALRLARRIIADPAHWVQEQALMAESRVHGRWERLAGPDNGGAFPR